MTRTYEIRVEGELGEPLLRYLHCSHCTVPEETVVRVNATPTELADLLQKCSDQGLIIERVLRISPTTVSTPAAKNR